MKRIRIHRKRGEDRPVSYDGHHGPMRYVDRQDNSMTVVVDDAGGEGELEYGPSTPGPFGDILGRVGDIKIMARYAKWGRHERGRHAFEVEFGDEGYVLVSRGRRRPKPHLEYADGRVLARFGRRRGVIAKSATASEAMLVALIGGSGLANLTLPQLWLPRH